jgi:hypothetical protein
VLSNYLAIDTYERLALSQGWPLERYSRWLAHAVTRYLLMTDRVQVAPGQAEAARFALARRTRGAKFACNCASVARFWPMSACW